jgi:hypothetical protein
MPSCVRGYYSLVAVGLLLASRRALVGNIAKSTLCLSNGSEPQPTGPSGGFRTESAYYDTFAILLRLKAEESRPQLGYYGLQSTTSRRGWNPRER